MFWKDARNYQILFLGTFLVLGIATRDWTLRLDLIGIIILVADNRLWSARPHGEAVARIDGHCCRFMNKGNVQT